MMFLGVADFHMPDEESRKFSGHLIIKLCKRTYVVICMIIIWFSPLTVNNHVVHDHTTVHHLPHLRFRPSKNWIPDNSKTRMKHTNAAAGVGGGPLTRVNSTNVLNEGLRIGEIGRRMNLKVKLVKIGMCRK
jgi:hypothetical protein